MPTAKTTRVRVLPIALALVTAAVAVTACFEPDEAIEGLPCDDEGDCPGTSVCLQDALYSYRTCQPPPKQDAQCSAENGPCNMLACCDGLVCNPDTISCARACTYGSGTECASGPDCCDFPSSGSDAICMC
ncbi:MAG: hypothetical protein IPK74_33460 [Deltaproteobacteria bacterium]|nr:hypothetical protein [Deltaproteobacteria bacterium]